MDSKKQDRVVVEDGPQYRSVMMAGPMSAPPMPRSFATMRPAKAATQTMQATQQTSIACIWHVAELPTLPAAYFLERSNVYVEGEPQDIADRICDCLRKQSIASTCDEEDKNLLVAETCECVRFAIRLFTDQGKIVVELQRKCGCSYQFREAARCILRSAKGDTAKPPKRSFNIPSVVPRDTEEQHQQRAEEGLEIAVMQLCADHLDSQLIGMGSLEQITRCERPGTISRKVLEGSCLEKVLFAAQDDVTNARSDMEERHIRVMKRRALTVLANAFSALASCGELDSVLGCTPELTSDGFASGLVDDLRDCSNAPHEGAQAARCIQYLINSKEVQKLLSEMSAISVVVDACTCGAIRSSLLEEESKKLMQLVRT